jgi:hypothetical protein
VRNSSDFPLYKKGHHASPTSASQSPTDLRVHQKANLCETGASAKNSNH